VEEEAVLGPKRKTGCVRDLSRLTTLQLAEAQASVALVQQQEQLVSPQVSFV
jgi:hypothetical protein